MTRNRSIHASHTFLFILVSFVIYIVFFFLQLGPGEMPNAAVRIVILIVALASIIVLHYLDKYIREAFSIPFALYILHTCMSYTTGNYKDYFFLNLGITCLGALFFNGRELLKFILISNLISTVQVFLKIPIVMHGLSGRAAMTMLEMIYSWSVALMGAFFIYIVITFAERKNVVAKSAHDSFVGLLTSTPEPIVLLDNINRVTYISDSFLKVVHIDQSMFAKGRSIFDLFSDQKLKDLFYEILSEGGPYQSIHEVILDGQQRFFEIVVFVIAGETGGRLVNIIDITPVMKARYEAEAASKSKTAFLATMSHEIRTPLNAIIGLSEIELQKKLPRDTSLDLEKIHNSGTSLLAIINDILDISKIEAGSLELIPVDYDVPSMVNDTVHLNIMRIGSKNLALKLKIDAGLPIKLCGDELRIKQVLNNLLSNAIKYTEEGNVVLTITWEKLNGVAWITFVVKDTGRGIKPDDLPKLFSEYQQFDTKANRHIEGTGLGLSITKKLISLMDGRINVESEYGRGSTFTARIPQKIVNETSIGRTIAKNLEDFRYKEIHSSDGLRLVRNHMPYGKVLVVDDVETNLDVAKGLMLPYGLSIDTASSGPEAIAKIRAISKGEDVICYDLILMDHMMPGMDGIEAVRIIRNEISGDYGATVPIVALTANALAGNEEIFLSNGFNGFISKPIDIMQLDAALNTWVRNKKNDDTFVQEEMDMAGDINANQKILDSLQIEGIDLVRGCQRYNGESIYMEILRSWHTHTPVLLEKLKNPSDEGLPEYAIAVHGLKGSSFGICADAIGNKADELERHAKSGNIEQVKALNPPFFDMVELMLAKIGGLLEKAAEGKKQKPTKPAVDQGLLAKLLDAVKRYQSTLMEEIMYDIEAYDYESDMELVAWLREQMDNLEYDAIRERLESR